jgi:competence protein ComEA
MDVVSDVTLVTGSPEGPVTFPPGAVVQLPAGEAKDLIARGLARPARKPLPELSQQEREHEGTEVPMEEVDGDTLDNRTNVNTASAADIAKAIKGVGRKTARDIVANREADGPFQSLDELANRVGGVSLAQLQAADVTV